jgi:2-polyprenyl-3-methyl-5-hydroxy-6-metoxy-1,4-benzoquinol methylase
MIVPRETFSRVQVEACPVCSNTTNELYILTCDYSSSKEDFQIVKCLSCGFRFTSPIPAEEHLGQYYQFADYISHTNRSGGLMGFVYRRVRSIALKQKVRLIQRYAKAGPLLDIGCGTGFFSAAAAQAGYQVTALEPDEGARKYAIEHNKVNALPAHELARLTGPFNVITLWHVLEHMYHLKRDAAAMAALVAQQGALVIAVPNCDSFDAQHYKQYWAGYDVPRHLYHFVQRDLEALFAPHGLKLKQIAPMKFDAYYVSMLSQQHMGKGKLKGLLTGWRSNRQARAGKSPWSSQIYIFTR